MKFLLDTYLLLWVASDPDRLSLKAKKYIDNMDNELFFSPASLWEIAIKNSLMRDDFCVEPRLLRRGLRDNGYCEMSITSDHTLFISHLPLIHKDPFDRLLIAQSIVEEMTLLTSDNIVAQYSGSIQLV